MFPNKPVLPGRRAFAAGIVAASLLLGGSLAVSAASASASSNVKPSPAPTPSGATSAPAKSGLTASEFRKSVLDKLKRQAKVKRKKDVVSSDATWVRYFPSSTAPKKVKQWDKRQLSRAKSFIAGPLNDLAGLATTNSGPPSDAPSYGLKMEPIATVAPVILKNAQGDSSFTFFLQLDPNLALSPGANDSSPAWPGFLSLMKYPSITVVFKGGTTLLASDIMFPLPGVNEGTVDDVFVDNYPYIPGDNEYWDSVAVVYYKDLPLFSKIIDPGCKVAASIEVGAKQPLVFTDYNSGAVVPASANQSLISTAVSTIFNNFGSNVCALEYTGGNTTVIPPGIGGGGTISK